jgi:opacity protein-like surface antigen
VKEVYKYFLIVFLLTSTLGTAQANDVLGTRKVQDYFKDVESKSYYQQERIRSTKREMNEYSKRLHSLQERFNHIFYGKSKKNSHENPFEKEPRVPYPKRQYTERRNKVSTESRPGNPVNFLDESNQLAFTVEQGNAKPPRASSGIVSKSTDLKTLKSTSARSISAIKTHLKGYFILRPGFTIPHRSKTKNYPDYPGKSKHREYENGFSLLVSGGFKFSNGFKIGGGAFHRKTKHDSGKSFQEWPNLKVYYPNGSESISWGGFVEFGYEHALNDFFNLYSDFGVGYGVSITDKTLGSDIDDFVFLTGALGVSWTPVDFFALSMGYRYLHEEEVPAHAIELGIEGKF